MRTSFTTPLRFLLVTDLVVTSAEDSRPTLRVKMRTVLIQKKKMMTIILKTTTTLPTRITVTTGTTCGKVYARTCVKLPGECLNSGWVTLFNRRITS